MPFEFKEPKKSLNSALLKQAVPQQEIEKLKKNFKVYLESEKPDEQEEYHKNLLRDLLTKTWYAPNSVTPKKSREDLVIYSENTAGSKPAVIIEVKSPHGNFPEMFSEKNQNCKALQECVLYFMQEFFLDENHEVKHVIITNYNEFYIFDAKNFVNFFCVKSNPIVAEFQKLSAKQLSDSTRKCFYENCAKPAIDRWIENEKITVIHFSMRDYCDANDKKLIQLYKILSPEFLLNKPLPNNSNTLNREFYNELLHIIGLEEVKEGNKKIIHRKSETKRESASLIESAMSRLEERISDENERFETALRLAITWINRLIFLKLVESQQLSYHQGESDRSKYEFLTTNLISNFHDLDDLFFKVLGRRPENRDVKLKEKFQFVPYLNSSLFELSEEENSYISINAIPDNEIPLFSQTVLKDERGKQRKGPMNILNYILAFLDAYDFSSRITENGIVENTKTLINASVLGLIFEKINGYKDGSFFTPPFITEYMAKETIERVIIQKFNDFNGWKCGTLEELKDKIKDSLSENKEKTLVEANEIINSIRICDPAVGSGHFLVSVLNRLLFIKSYLDILLDKNGGRIRRSDYEVQLDENDEISILDEKGKHFAYSINSERQLVQEAIFNEKRTIIENCLFGVDINPASVYICRLRLWIELLKNAYYTKESNFTQLETLPNIDINIKCGDSLVSKYLIKTGSSLFNEEGNLDTRKLIKQYREAVAAYKNENNKEKKQEVKDLLKIIKSRIHDVAQSEMYNETYNQKLVKNEDENIYNNSLEWMIEFPEILDENGNFLGFDAVIGNPPYISANNIKNSFLKDFFKLRYKTARKMFDLYSLFTELSSWLLKPNGSFSFIFSNSWLGIQSFLPFRKFLAEDVSVTHLVKLPDKVFDNATVKTIICSYQNKKPNIDDEIEIKNCNKDEIFSSECKLSYKKILSTHGYNFTFEQNIDLNKVQTVKLGSIMKASCGIKSANDKKFILNEKRDEDCYPIIRGRNLRRWEQPVNTANEYIWYKPELMKENINARPRELSFFNVPQKIMIQDMSIEINATLDCEQYLCNDKINVIYELEKGYDMKFILALLNSKLINFWFRKLFTSGFEIKLNQLETIPIPVATKDQQKQIVELVDEILEIKKKSSPKLGEVSRSDDGVCLSFDTRPSQQADSPSNLEGHLKNLEAEIDKLVYELYGLTDDEIAIVEGKNI